MQDTFQWTDELVSDFLKYHFGQFEPLNTSMEQFKSSKSPKREWEIVAFRYLPNGNIITDNRIAGWDMAQGGDDAYSIHSVRRLSDDWTVSVKDKVKTVSGKIGTIQAINADGHILFSDITGLEHITTIQKLPQPVLTTIDGVEILEGMEFWPVGNLQILPFSPHQAKESDRGWWKTAKIFSTHEAAEEYILNNRPLLSLNDVRDKLSEWVAPGLVKFVIGSLTALVKQKLN